MGLDCQKCNSHPHYCLSKSWELTIAQSFYSTHQISKLHLTFEASTVCNYALKQASHLHPSSTSHAYLTSFPFYSIYLKRSHALLSTAKISQLSAYMNYSYLAHYRHRCKSWKDQDSERSRSDWFQLMFLHMAAYSHAVPLSCISLGAL